jgi:hypothetical protein
MLNQYLVNLKPATLPDNTEGTVDVVPPEDWMLRGYQRTTSLQEIAESIWWGNAIIGINGSAANDHGTYSFIILTDIVNESPTLSVKCGGNLPNLAEYIDMDSHHPKGAALFSALCFVHLLLTKYPRGPITGVVPKLQFVLDNKSVAEDSLKWTYGQETSVFDYLKSDYDLLQGIQREIEPSPLHQKLAGLKDTKIDTSSAWNSP